MSLGLPVPPTPKNEPIYSYAPNSKERELLKKELARQKSIQVEVPVIIGGQEYKTGDIGKIQCPHDHSLKLGTFHRANADLVKKGIESAVKAQKEWAATSWEMRASVFLRAAELLSSDAWRYKINAATMLGQGKNPFQAEIDSACELIDFFNFNVSYMRDIYTEQPPISPKGVWNRVEYRPLEGFIFAVTPFNFTAIAGNLNAAPAMLGNVCVWKPSESSILSAYYLMQLFKEAGLPDGVINLVPGKSSEMAPIILDHKDLAGVHFTGSTGVFQSIWKRIGENLGNNVYKSYPRIVGETGGKDFIMASPDCDVKGLAVAMVRGAFEYQGQKCSAASRAYVPKSIWPSVQSEIAKMMETMKVGDVTEFDTFVGAVINKKSFDNAASYIDYAKSHAKDHKIVFGGKYDDSKGYFIYPTIVETSDPKSKLMQEEIFAPILTVYVYEDAKFDEALKLVDETSPYALTGAIWATNRMTIDKMTKALTNAAGNFYINDKPTGAVVGQQPFGGARASGTNDKAGSSLNLYRWVNVRTIKETFTPIHDYRYPHMQEK